MSLCSKR